MSHRSVKYQVAIAVAIIGIACFGFALLRRKHDVRNEHIDPFSGLNSEDIYQLLIDSANDLPQWPDEKTQAGYVATKGPQAVTRTQDFIHMLDTHGAFVVKWKGLDYGAGWGRIASLLLSKGGSEQLDLVDAWQGTLDILARGNFKNRKWKVSEILADDEIPEAEYDFVYAFSVFTHLAPRAFWLNLQSLACGVKSGGSVYFTVRHEEFIAHISEHRYLGKSEEIASIVRSEGFWFAYSGGDLGNEAVFGDMIVSEEHLRASLSHLGTLDYLGQPLGQMQHVYALRVH